MIGGPSVSDSIVAQLIEFEEEYGARSPGWFRATCAMCVYASTTGSEPTVEDWAYEHVREEHSVIPDAILAAATLDTAAGLFWIADATDELEFYGGEL